MVESTSASHPTILCGADAAGSIKIGVSGDLSETYPHIKNPKAGNGIKSDSSNVTINKYSGKVD